jgi:hypothetical protein
VGKLDLLSSRDIKKKEKKKKKKTPEAKREEEDISTWFEVRRST